jgi:hypothetical protein
MSEKEDSGLDTSMDSKNNPSTGNEWESYYRGYGLSVSASQEVWWQAYNGTERLKLEPTPTDMVENLLEIKSQGGAVRVTEGGSVITKVQEEESEGEDDQYTTVYVGETDLGVELVPESDETSSISTTHSGLTPGDLWPSVYDGAKFSFSGSSFWWENPETKLRHHFTNQPPQRIVDNLTTLRPRGGSFRITPNGDVLTQVPPAKAPPDARKQFEDLPVPVKRLLKLRRVRGDVDMLPVYVGSIEAKSMSVEEPTRLTDPLSEQEKEELKTWVENIDGYEEKEINEDDHKLGSGGG